MKISDIRSLSSSELEAKASDLAEALFKLKFQHGIRQLENTAKLAEIRKDVARVKTVLREKQREAAA